MTIREALRLRLRWMTSERDADIWRRQPLSAAEQSLRSVDDWGPAEHWADWAPPRT